MLPGSVSGLIEVVVTQPVEYYRVARQLGHAPHPSRAWRGMGVRLAGVMPIRAAFWGVQDHVMRMRGVSPVQKVLAAGVLSSAVQTCIEIPFEAVKTRRMEGSSFVAKDVLNGAKWHFARNLGFALGLSVGRLGATVFPDHGLGLTVAATLASAVITQPLDVMKTVAQSSARSTPKRMFVGVVPRSLQCCLAMGIGHMVLESMQKPRVNVH